MIAYYKNSKGEILNLTKAPFRTVEADWFDSDWTESSEGYEKTVNIDVFGKREEFVQNMERLYSVIAVDAEENTYGQLYVNDTFLRCRIQSSTKENWKGYVYSEVELTFIAPELSWVTEVTRQFSPRSEASGTSGLDYPYDYPFDFAEEKFGVATWDVDHVKSSEFQMIMYGPCTNPYVLINNHSYAVYTDLEAGEYLIIDSRSSTIYKYLSNGTAENLFNERGLADSTFKPIPSGLLHINWSGEFGFDLTLFLERREARWENENPGNKPGDDTGDGGDSGGLKLQDKTVNPTHSVQNVKADSGYDGLGQVTVNAIPEAYTNTSDADATSNDIVSPKTAYVDGEKIRGALTRQTSALTAGMVTRAGTDDKVLATYLNLEMLEKRIFYDSGDNVQLYVPLSTFGDATAEDVAEGKTFTSENGYAVTGTRSGTSTGGNLIRYGTTDSPIIDTGLSSIKIFGIATMNATTGTGLCNAMFNSYEDADHVNMSYCNSSSDYLKMYTYTASSSYFSISGGVFEWTGAGNYALQEGMEYQWFAIGT